MKSIEFYYLTDSDNNFVELLEDSDMLIALDDIEGISELRLNSIGDVENTIEMLYRELEHGELKAFDVKLPLKSVKYKVTFEQI